MFFTDYGQIPKVERCDMDGQNRTKLVDSKIVFPHGITLDLVNRLVYWADAYLDYIEVVDYEGKNRHTIIQGILVSGFGAGWGRGRGLVSELSVLGATGLRLWLYWASKNVLSTGHGPAEGHLVPAVDKATLMDKSRGVGSGVLRVAEPGSRDS